MYYHDTGQEIVFLLSSEESRAEN